MSRILVTFSALAGLACSACAVRKSPAVAATQYNMDRQAINAVNSGDGDYELRTLRAKLDANTNDLATRLELARRYQKLGFYEVAIEHCRLACERAPESDEAHIALAKMLRDAGRPAEGVTVLANYTKTHTENATLWAWLGLMRDVTGEWKAGEAAHRKALALAPGRDDLHNNLGYCLLRQNKKKEAVEEFRAALKINPASVVATNNLAAALSTTRGSKKDDASKKEAVQRLQSVADPATAHNNLAAVLIEEGSYEEAREEIDIALSYNRQHSAALSNLELVSELDGKPAVLKLPLRMTSEGEGKWARARRVWHRFWGDGVANQQTARPADGSTLGTTASSR
jgi:Flp pilus assembly protein TadD